MRVTRRPGSPPSAASSRTTGYVILAYSLLAAIAVGSSLVRGQSPLITTPWLALPGAWLVTLSVLLGLALGCATIVTTRGAVRRFAWARALHADLRPAVRGASDVTLVAMALASGFGEELFFRGLLTPLIGVWLSSIAFGLLHQVRGRARLAWALWATSMGLAFALVFVATGSLAGAIVAHALINAANLRYLRDTDPAPKPRALGGLLRRA